jgi:hypothetical protein
MELKIRKIFFVYFVQVFESFVVKYFLYNLQGEGANLGISPEP